MKLRLFSTLSAAILAPLASADIHVMTAALDGSQEVPAVATPATGSATITVDTATGYVHVIGTFANLVSPVTVAHLHGLAGVGGIGGVLFPLNLTGGSTSGAFEGAATLSGANVQGILAGMSYVNVHSTLHGGGEIRGQVGFPLVTIDATMDGPQAGITTPGTGAFSVTINRNTRRVDLSGTYTGLLGAVSAAHIHGPAWIGQNAGILVTLTHTGGTSGTLSGSMVVSSGVLASILEGFSYVNVHTSFAGGGEIRGQVFETLGTAYCLAAPNSTGSASVLSGSGSPRAADNDVQLDVVGLPQNAFGYFIMSQSSVQVFPLSMSSGRICVSGPIVARLGNTVQNAGVSGTFSAQIDMTAIPTNPPASVTPGDTWNFQAWHRDLGPTGVTSNFTNALSVSFR